MKQTVMGSDEARINFRDVLDAVTVGETVFVERYGKPVAVVISVREYERFQNDHQRLIEYILAEAKPMGEIEFAPGEPITPETIEEKAKAKGWLLSELEPA